MSIRLTKDQRNNVVVSHFFNVGEVGDVRVMYQHKPQDECLKQRNLGSNNRTTPQQMGHRKNYIIFGVAFDGWLFIREACQEFKGCLRFKDFLQLMRLILDFQVTQCWTKKVV